MGYRATRQRQVLGDIANIAFRELARTASNIVILGGALLI